jgi:hypothetical protein
MTAKKKAAPRKRRKRKANPAGGVPVIALNPAPRRKRRRKANPVKKKRTVRRRRRHNPGNPANPRRRRRRRHNPAHPWWKGPLGVGLALVGAAVAIGVNYGLTQTDMANGTIGYIQAIGGTAGGLGLSLLSPEAGGGLAVSSLMRGGMRLLGASPTKSAPALNARSSIRLPSRSKVRTGALQGLDGEDLDALGAMTAMLGDGYDDDDGGEMGAVTAQLGAVTTQLGDGYDDDDGEMGAVTAQLGDFEPDEMAAGDDDDDGGEFGDGDDDDGGEFGDGYDDDDGE